MLDLEKYICKIANENDKVIGTGFFVLPDGYIVTCHHVIKGLKGNVKVGISSESEPIKGEIVRNYEAEDKDIAVLKINREKCPFLLLSTESESGDYIFSHGFSIDNSLKDFPKGFPVKSVLTLPTTLENGLKMFVLENTKVNSGLSGAPAVNDKGNVIGIIRMEYKEKALVIPIEYLFGMWSDLEIFHKKSLQEKNNIKPELPDILTIQSVLRKGITKEGDFFRKEPEWVDFEQGYIVERKEVDEIIEKLESEKQQLVLGVPASGKSVILKNIGLKLANKNKKVYIIQLKEYSGDKIKLYLENILKPNDENAVYIVDDAHLYISECENLVRDFEITGKGKLIVGSRETREVIKGTTTKFSLLEYLKDRYIKIKAEDITEKMIKCFLKRKHEENNFSAKRIEIVSENLAKYKRDLWYLSWALKSYNPEKDSVEENEIYENIKDRIREINAEDVFLPLSVFYRFEIPIERKFLKKQLGIKDEVIDNLIRHSEIRETEEIRKPVMLSLHHSSLAELYFDTYQNYRSLGDEIREKILNQNSEKDLYYPFYKYLTTYPGNSVGVVISLGRDSSDEKGGLTLLRKLIEKNEIQKPIETGINEEDDLEKIGMFMRSIIRLNKSVAIKLADIVSARVEKEEDLIKVGKCFSDIAWVDKDVAKELINGISKGIKKEEDIERVKWLIKVIAKVDEEAALRLELVDSVLWRIEKEKDIEKIERCLYSIARKNREVGLKLVDINVLSAKIKKEEDLQKIEQFIKTLTLVNVEPALNIINIISSDIKKEEDIAKIGKCISAIKWKYETAAEKTFYDLSPKIRERLIEGNYL